MHKLQVTYTQSVDPIGGFDPRVPALVHVVVVSVSHVSHVPEAGVWIAGVDALLLVFILFPRFVDLFLGQRLFRLVFEQRIVHVIIHHPRFCLRSRNHLAQNLILGRGEARLVVRGRRRELVQIFQLVRRVVSINLLLVDDPQSQ